MNFSQFFVCSVENQTRVVWHVITGKSNHYFRPFAMRMQDQHQTNRNDNFYLTTYHFSSIFYECHHNHTMFTHTHSILQPNCPRFHYTLSPHVVWSHNDNNKCDIVCMRFQLTATLFFNSMHTNTQSHTQNFRFHLLILA